MLRTKRSKLDQLGVLAILALVLSLLSATTEAADGRPGVDSKEYKILLQVDRFTDRTQGVSQFWNGVVGVAKQIDIPVNGSMDKVKQRRVRFVDTKNFALRNDHRFVFRIRTDLKRDGSPKDRDKVTLKYRGESVESAAEIDASSTAGEDREQKLEQDIVPRQPIDSDGPHVSKFSKSGSTEIKKAKKRFKRIRDIADVFPVLERLPKQKKKVRAVNGFQAHEIKIEGAEITLDDEHEAEPSFTFWYDRKPDGALLVAEFSFSYKVGPEAPATLDQNADRFFEAILTELKEWVEECPKTKTQIAYEYRKPAAGE